MDQKEAALEKLFQQNYDRLCQLAARLLHDDEEGKDVVNDVFARLAPAPAEQMPETVEPAPAKGHADGADDTWTFQNVELEEILTEVAAYYHLRTEYRSEASRHIRFYVKWDKSEGVAPLVERLNQSEKVI